MMIFPKAEREQMRRGGERKGKYGIGEEDLKKGIQPKSENRRVDMK